MKLPWQRLATQLQERVFRQKPDYKLFKQGGQNNRSNIQFVNHFPLVIWDFFLKAFKNIPLKDFS